MKKITVLALLTFAVVRMHAQSVGIGDTIPQAKLHIKSNSTLFGNSSLLVNNSANEVLMNIRDNGFTGIGTASPAARLHIRNDFETFRIQGNSSYLSFYDDAGEYKGYLWQKAGNAIELGSASASGLPVIIAPNNVPDISFMPAGLTGIGNSNPAFRLDVSGRMRLRATGGQTAGIWFNNNFNTVPLGFVGVNTDNTYGFYGDVAGWSFLINSTTGNAGLGDLPNGSRLMVRGGTSALDIGTTLPNATALMISNGGVEVAGAGINSSTVAFVHKASNANSPAGLGYTVIDNPYCNNSSSVILQVTMNATYGPGTAPGNEVVAETIGSATTCQVLTPTSFMVFYNGPNSGFYAAAPAYARDKWCIRVYTGCFVANPLNFNFNVFVIKPA